MPKFSPLGKPLCVRCRKLATSRLCGHHRTPKGVVEFYAYHCTEHAHKRDEPLPDDPLSHLKFVEGSSADILSGNAAVKTFELGKTGLGYYINPKPEEVSGSFCTVGEHSEPVSSSAIIHTSDLCDWYKPIHLPSKRGLGVTFFSESLVRHFVRALVPYLDWSGDAESLEKQDNWQNIGILTYEIRDSCYEEHH